MKNLVKALLLSGNVPFIKGKPGTAKSSVMHQLADDCGWLYIDLRLSQKDETDIAGLPVKDSSELGIPVTTYALPQWFEKAKLTAENGQGVLIHFEELNRTTKAVRDACLEILNERTINNVKLPSNVYMVASGNLGSEDGCDVDDMDSALVTRLVPLNWDMTYKTWREEYAVTHIDPLILGFLDLEPGYFHNPDLKHEIFETYPMPRSWTNFSKYLQHLRTLGVNDDTMPTKIDTVGVSFIGKAYAPFIKYVRDLKELTVDDILNNWEGCQHKISPDRRRVYLPALDTINKWPISKFTGLNKKQFNNFKKFGKNISKEDVASILHNLIRKSNQTDVFTEDTYLNSFCLEHKEIVKDIVSGVKK